MIRFVKHRQELLDSEDKVQLFHVDQMVMPFGMNAETH